MAPTIGPTIKITYLHNYLCEIAQLYSRKIWRASFEFNATGHPQTMIVRFAVSIPLSNPVSAYAAAQQTTEIATIARKWLFRFLIIKSRSSGFIRFACEREA